MNIALTDVAEGRSSQIAAVGYDAATKTLAIKFKSGSTYHYLDVPQEIYDGLLASDSVGKFLGASVKGVYKFSALPRQDN